MTTIRAMSAAALVLSAITNHASAQSPAKNDPWADLKASNETFKRERGEAKRHPRVRFEATTLAPVTQSMTDLLNNGWGIVGGSVITGFSLKSVRDDGHQWIVCELNDGRDGNGGHAGSQCKALN